MERATLVHKGKSELFGMNTSLPVRTCYLENRSRNEPRPFQGGRQKARAGEGEHIGVRGFREDHAGKNESLEKRNQRQIAGDR